MLRSAALWRAALKPLRCLCIPVLLRGCLPSCISSSLPCDLQKLILLDNILGEHIQYFPVEDDSGVDEGWHVFAEKAIRRAEASWLTLANSYCLVRISNMPMLSHDLCFLVINNIESLTSQNSFFFYGIRDHGRNTHNTLHPCIWPQLKPLNDMWGGMVHTSYQECHTVQIYLPASRSGTGYGQGLLTDIKINICIWVSDILQISYCEMGYISYIVWCVQSKLKKKGHMHHSQESSGSGVQWFHQVSSSSG